MKESRSEKIRSEIDKVRENIARACARSGRDVSDVKIMAVTKTVPAEDINTAINYGIDLIGENRVQEYLSKRDGILPAETHIIGSLQTNKVKYIIDKVSMIQSVDSVRLAREIGKRAIAIDKTMDILVEVNIGREESKGGIFPEAAEETVAEIGDIPGIKVRGLMTIPPICEKSAEVSKFFENMRRLFVDIEAKKIDNVSMDILSMGMSGDYISAIEHGTNIVRLGRAIFGERKYLTGDGNNGN